MNTTFSHDQLYTTKILINLQRRLNDLIMVNLQEVFLRKALDDNEIIKEINALDDHLRYTIEDELSYAIRYINN